MEDPCTEYMTFKVLELLRLIQWNAEWANQAK